MDIKFPGVFIGIDLVAIDILVSQPLVGIPGIVTINSVLYRNEKEIVVCCIYRIAYIQRCRPLTVFEQCRIEYIIPTHVQVSVGAKIQGFFIVGNKRGLLVVGRVYFWSQVYSRAPVACRVPFGFVNIEIAVSPFSVTGKVEGIPIPGYAGMRLPVFGVDVIIQLFNRRPDAIPETGYINITVIFIIFIEIQDRPVVR